MDNSLTRPQLIHQWIEAEKEQSRIAGLHVNQVLVNQTQERVETAYELLKKAEAEGYFAPGYEDAALANLYSVSQQQAVCNAFSF